MRIWVALAIAVLAGLSTGVVTAVVRHNLYPWPGVYAPIGGEENVPRTVSVEDAVPRVVVDNDTYDFGVMDSNATGSHTFVFTNVGTAPLRLQELSTSCKCTVSEIQSGEILPGQSGTVTIQWNGKGVTGPFRHTATIGTNDPTRERVVLTIQGRLTPTIKADPNQLVFTRIAAGDEAAAQLRVFGFQTKPRLALTGCELEDPETARFFEVSWTEMPVEEVKAEEEDATCGYLVDVRIKPGLPSGTFHQTIQLKTNLEKAPSISIPVRGRVESEISIVGPGWHEQAGTLTLGTVSGQKGTKRTLMIVVGGPDRHKVWFKPAEVVPDVLKVHIGPTREAADGSVTMTPLEISIPPGSPSARYFGPSEDRLGKILIETSHPRVSQLKLLVRFIVQR